MIHYIKKFFKPTINFHLISDKFHVTCSNLSPFATSLHIKQSQPSILNSNVTLNFYFGEQNNSLNRQFEGRFPL